MLTNNFLSVLTTLFTNTDAYKTPARDTTYYEGSTSIIYPANFYRHNASMCIGTGTTPAKRTDYKLESEISSENYTSTYNVVSTNSYDIENSSLTIQATFTNIGSEDLIVSEVGAFGSSMSQYSFMWARKVFDQPITIAVGETKSFVIDLF